MATMGTVWDRATEFLSDNLATVMPVALFAIFLPVSVQGNLAPMMAGASPTVTIGLQAVNLFLSVVSMIGQLGIIALALDPARSSGDAFGVALGRLPAALLVALVELLLLGLLFAPVIVALVIAGVDLQTIAATGKFDPTTLNPGIAAFIGIYSLLCLVVLIWVIARLILAMPVVVGERRALGAIGRSFALTRGVAMKIIGVAILYYVVSTVAVLAAKTVFGSILALIAGGEGALNIGSVLTSIIVAMVATAFAALSAAFTAKLYVAASRGAEGVADAA